MLLEAVFVVGLAGVSGAMVSTSDSSSTSTSWDTTTLTVGLVLDFANVLANSC